MTIAYGSVEAVGDLDRDLPEGKITALVGANGSGKCTILKAATQILRTTHGAVYLDGNDIHSDVLTSAGVSAGIDMDLYLVAGAS